MSKKGTAMSKVSTMRVVSQDRAPELPDLPEEVRLALSEAAASAREGLLAMSVATGLRVMHAMMQAEITTLAGPRGRHDPDRAAVRHGSAPSSVTLGARRVPVTRPRARRTEGTEVQLESFTAFAGDDLLAEAVLSRMLAGLACRRFTAGSEPVGAQVEAGARSTSRSAVSRRFVRATETALAELLARDLSDLAVAAVMVDGVHLGEHLMVVALAITTDGTKVPVGLYEGDTENATVVTSLLADLVERGLDTTGGVLFVLDGAKALATAVHKVFGSAALIQRCTLHKRRNVADHLPRGRGRTHRPQAGPGVHPPRPRPGAARRPRPRDLAGPDPPLGRGQHPGRARGDVHRPPARDLRGAGTHADHHEPDRVDDLHHPHHPAQRQELEGRRDGTALDRRRDARRRNAVPPDQGPPGHAAARRRTGPTHRLPATRNCRCHRLE